MESSGSSSLQQGHNTHCLSRVQKLYCVSREMVLGSCSKMDCLGAELCSTVVSVNTVLPATVETLT